jgi:hypothetical protein
VLFNPRRLISVKVAQALACEPTALPVKARANNA